MPDLDGMETGEAAVLDRVTEIRRKIEKEVERMPQSKLRALSVAAVAAAAVLVAFGYAYRSNKRERREVEREAEYVAFAVSKTEALHRIGQEFLGSNRESLPAEFGTLFRPSEGDRDPLLGVAIQEAGPDGAFVVVARADNYGYESRGEYATPNPQPLSGTDVYMSRGLVAIDGVEYRIRIFRRNVGDAGRVALMIFDWRQ